MKPLLYILVGVVVTVCSVAIGVSGKAYGTTPQGYMQPGPSHVRHSSSELVQEVRNATQAYRNVSQAEAAGYVLFEGCVSGEDEGAMGVHYLNPALVGDGTVNLKTPEMLVYEPRRNGSLRLVAVEYITFKQAWESVHGEGVPPIMAGQLFDFHNAPNRFAVPAVYGLHIWAWKYNPKGLFAEWNPRVTCKYYAPPTVSG